MTEEKQPIVDAEAAIAEQEQEEQYHEHYHYQVDPNQSPMRIDKFLVARMEKASRSKIKNAAIAGCILVNEKPVKVNYKVRPKDNISIVLPKPMQKYQVEPEPMDLQIEYEDDYLLVVHKPPGMVVHPGCGNYTGTLVHGLMHHFNNLPVNKTGSGVSIEGQMRPGLVHRIDKDTSGLLVVAKTDEAMTKLAKQFFDHTVIRRYVALVWGDVIEDEGTITGHVGRHERYRKIMTVYPEGEKGKHAITHYKVLERFGYVTLVECRLETGRTHQIRVHFQHMRHTLFSDTTYGGDKILKGTVYTKYRQFANNCFKLLPRQALHAKILGFTHPITQEELYFESPLPNDIQQVVDKWRRYMGS